MTDPAFGAGVAPGPAERVVEHFERFSGLELPDDGGFVGWTVSQDGRDRDDAMDRIGIMRRDHPTGERDIGKVLAIGVEVRVGVLGRAGEREPVSDRARTPGLVR